MRQFRHVVSFVELGRIDFVDLICVDLSLLLEALISVRFLSVQEPYLAIIGLDQQTIFLDFLQN